MFLKIIVCMTLLFCDAEALKIEITQGNKEPQPTAVVFFDNDGNESEISSEISLIVKEDLQSTGLFAIINDHLFIENQKALCTNGHNIKNWKVLGVRFLVYGKILVKGDSFFAEFKLVDV
ncbi:MAG: hypothetical protein LBF70_02030, partial [Holosporales bacterium]|nr:hypothetical protein [Holosporales bacterium]